MVRAPCCEKMGLKKGPWTAEEDQVLTNYIQLHGHSNWRALPKQAGLLRCGKSCRLRWMNYLRPDIKRGNFTKEEEETIIQLHETLGNRWSTIAARLPGRTDNEIKNVWHTHLKKKLTKQAHCSSQVSETESGDSPVSTRTGSGSSSPQQSNSTSDNNISVSHKADDNWEGSFPVIDDDFWSEVLSADNSEVMGGGELGIQLPSFEMVNERIGENMDFWYNLFVQEKGNY